MRIVMPSRILDRNVGGNTTYAREIAKGLGRRGIKVGRIRAWRNAGMTMLQETTTGLVDSEPGDVLHYVADTGPLLPTRRPSVVTVHGVASRWVSVARNPRQEKIWRMRVQRAVDCTDHVITVSNSSAQDLQAVFGIDSSRLTTIEHGIDVKKFSRPTRLSDYLAARLPERFALYLGNIEPRKNLVALVEAFDHPAVRTLDLPLVVAGKPAWNAEESLAAMECSDRVVRLGFVSDEDRTALMQSCTVFVFPSLYEGFGFPVLEALAAGAVVLSSDKGSLAEVAGPSLRLENTNPSGIVEGIERAVVDEAARRECLANGRRWAEKYTWGSSVEKHISVYERLLA
jgi:glycosyltransferase involved in cell wall biosynthesis